MTTETPITPEIIRSYFERPFRITVRASGQVLGSYRGLGDEEAYQAMLSDSTHHGAHSAPAFESLDFEVEGPDGKTTYEASLEIEAARKAEAERVEAELDSMAGSDEEREGYIVSTYSVGRFRRHLATGITRKV